MPSHSNNKVQKTNSYTAYFSQLHTGICIFSKNILESTYLQTFHGRRTQIAFLKRQTTHLAFLGETSRFTTNRLHLLTTKFLFVLSMYKLTHNLIAIPISDFLIPFVRPSRHYHPLSYRLITATTDYMYYKCSFFPRAVFHWNNLPLETVVWSTLEQFNQAVCKIDHVSP